jgi:hypothetical protein
VWKPTSENASSETSARPTFLQITLDNWFHNPTDYVMAAPFLYKSNDMNVISSVGAATTSLNSALSGTVAEYTGSLDATIDNDEDSELSTNLWPWETMYNEHW